MASSFRFFFWTLLLSVIHATHATAEPRTIFIPTSSTKIITDPYQYCEKLLALALKKSANPGERFIIDYHDISSSTERMRALLKANRDLDVIWSATNAEREEVFRAIPIHITKGINEYRLLLIRTSDREHFANIKTVDDLKAFKAGTGIYWEDTKVMRANQLPYATFLNINTMFKMLAAKRFDYISRGTNEVWAELEESKRLGLTLAPNIMLHYSLPIYFFVNKENTELAERIERGLKIATEDGSFDELFFSIPEHRRAYNEIHNSERRIIYLKSRKAEGAESSPPVNVE